MSDLSVAVSVSGFVGLEQDKGATETLNKVPEAVINATEIKSNNANAENELSKDKQNIEPAEVEQTVGELNAFMQSMQRNLSFSVDEELGTKVISVIDVESEEVIRQIPSEELLVLRKKLDDVSGILFEAKV